MAPLGTPVVPLVYISVAKSSLVTVSNLASTLSAYSAANGYSFNATDILLPIPQREINLSNGQLTQNPGY